MLGRDLPVIAAYDRVFRPLHQRLFTQPMTDFAVLSPDQLLQRSVFGDGTAVTVNFDTAPRTLPDGAVLPAQSARLDGPGRGLVVEAASCFSSRKRPGEMHQSLEQIRLSRRRGRALHRPRTTNRGCPK